MKRSRRLTLLFVSLAFISAVAFMSLEAETKPAKSQPTEATQFHATCWCVISKDNLWGVTHATGVLKDLTSAITQDFNFQTEPDQEACRDRCTDAARSYKKDQSIAAAACAANAGNGGEIAAYSAVGTKAYRSSSDMVMGNLVNQPQATQTTCTCPPTWTCNGCSPQKAGGITTDGVCKKMACQGNTISPYPPDGTVIGSWGFSWGNHFYAYGTSANGGAPHCVTTVTQPAMCGWF